MNGSNNRISAHRLFLFLLFTSILFRSLFGALALDTSRTTATIRRCKGKVNMFLGVKTNNEGRNVDDLLSDAA